MLLNNSDMLPFPASFVFPDVDRATLDAEEDAETGLSSENSSWKSYMHRVMATDARR